MRHVAGDPSRIAFGVVFVAFVVYASPLDAQSPGDEAAFTISESSGRPAIVSGETVRDLEVPAGCSDVLVAIEPSSELSFSVHRRDGERVADARVGVGRSVARVCRDRPESLVLAVRARGPGALSFFASPVAPGTVVSDDGTRTPVPRVTAGRSLASASARVNATITRLRDEGFELLEPLRVFVVSEPTTVPLSPAIGPCRLLVVAVEGGEATIGGAVIGSRLSREWVACGAAGESLEIDPTDANVRVAIAFLASPRFGFDERSIERARVLASLATRGFEVASEVDLLSASSESATVSVSAAPNRCLAIASPSRTLRALALVDASGAVRSLSSSRAPTIFHCTSDEPEVLRVRVVSDEPRESIRLLIAEDRP